MNISAERERQLVVALLKCCSEWKLVRELPKHSSQSDRSYLRNDGEPLNRIVVSSYTFDYLRAKSIIELNGKEDNDTKEIYNLKK